MKIILEDNEEFIFAHIKDKNDNSGHMITYLNDDILVKVMQDYFNAVNKNKVETIEDIKK